MVPRPHFEDKQTPCIVKEESLKCVDRELLLNFTDRKAEGETAQSGILCFWDVVETPRYCVSPQNRHFSNAGLRNIPLHV